MKFSHLRRLYINESIIENQSINIMGDDFHYLRSVMRLKKLETFRVFNEKDGEFLVKILDIGRSNLNIIVEKLLRPVLPEQELILAMCIIKPDRMLEAIRGAVQLGVTQIIPVISERVQIQKISREKILKSIINSTEQSERFRPTELLPKICLSDLCKIQEFEQIICASETEDIKNKVTNINKIQEKPVILIGPEGGFSEDEMKMIKSYKHIYSVSLGKNVLRAETAAITALSCISMIR